MKEEIKDARIIKTKEKLKDSLLELMNNKPIDSISVTELCNKAKVNRNTFYSHYDSPHKLLDEIEDNLYNELIDTLMKADLVNITFKDFLYSLLTSIYNNRGICTVLFGKYGDTEFIRNAIELPKSLVTESWKNTMHLSDFESSIRYTYFAGGAISVIKDWVNNGFYIRMEVLVDCLAKIIL